MVVVLSKTKHNKRKDREDSINGTRLRMKFKETIPSFLSLSVFFFFLGGGGLRRQMED